MARASGRGIVITHRKVKNSRLHLFNRMIGQFYHCPHTGQCYDETTAFVEHHPAAA